MKSYNLAITPLVVTVFLFANQVVAADVFENPKNLKFLPSDIKPDELRDVMLGFSGALNAKCSYCHMVDDDLKMPDPDYSDDAKWTKRTAREMLKMVADINRHISDIEFIPRSQRIEVTCITCHRGQYRPLLILPALEQALKAGGIDAVIEEYSKLRERYFGNHTYDLRPATLAGFARKIASNGDVNGSLKLLNFVNDNFPNEERVLFALARVNQQKGDNSLAITYLKRLVQLYPESSFYASELGKAVSENLDSDVTTTRQ